MPRDLSQYRTNRPFIQTGDLIEWQSHHFIGWAIRKFTKKIVNHTSAVVVLQILGDMQERKYIYEADENGFHPAFLSSRLKAFKGKAYWVPLKPKFNNHRVRIAKKLLSLDGKPYDYRSLFGNALRRQVLDEKKLYCSEAVHMALVKACLLKRDFNDGFGLRPGEFLTTGLYDQPIRIL